MLAHHTLGGCPLQVGDLLGSGTISGPAPGAEGCLLEKTAGGREPFAVGRERRTFLEDGDVVTLRGWAGDAAGGRVGFCECRTRIEPAWPM